MVTYRYWGIPNFYFSPTCTLLLVAGFFVCSTRSVSDANTFVSYHYIIFIFMQRWYTTDTRSNICLLLLWLLSQSILFMLWSKNNFGVSSRCPAHSRYTSESLRLTAVRERYRHHQYCSTEIIVYILFYPHVVLYNLFSLFKLNKKNLPMLYTFLKLLF